MKKLFLPFFFILSLLFISSCNDSSGKKEEKESMSADTTQKKQSNLKSEDVTYNTDSTEMKGYIVFDSTIAEKRPGVLVVHEWWGHNEYTRKRADMLAELGYVAMAVDMYGNAREASHPKDAKKFSKSVMSNFDEAKNRFREAMKTLKENPNVDAEQIAVIGYCFGGSVALSMANTGMDLDAVAAFHSGLQLPVDPKQDSVKAKILICNGADDPFVPQEQVDAYKAKMDEAGANYEYIAYDGVVHAYTNPNATKLGEKFDMPLKYDEEADKKSWEELKVLLRSTFD